MSLTKFLSLIAIVSLLTPNVLVYAKVDTWQKGGSLVPLSPTDFQGDLFKQSLKNLAAIHADYATLVIPWYQDNAYSTLMGPGQYTPTDESLISAINYAHSLGLKVNLKPHQTVKTGGFWRAHVTPSNRDEWFKNYDAMLNHYAQIAQQNNVELITLGTELINMTSPSVDSTNTEHWRAMIRQVRQIYSGKLTYSANWGDCCWWNEKNNIEFWDDLDYIGISAYFYMTPTVNYTMDSLKSRWSFWNDTQIRPLSQKFNKPVLFTEVGYRSSDGALMRPPKWDNTGIPDEQEQADGYEALFSYWDNFDYVQGIQLWDWETDPNGGGPGTSSFTPQNKLAESVITRWFGSGKPIGDKLAFSASVGTYPLNPATGQPVDMRYTVKNIGSVTANITTDLEIFNSQGIKVFQKFMENESIDPGQEKQFSAPWTPDASGSYKVKLGIFKSDWSMLYFWGDNILNFPVINGVGQQPTADNVVIYASDISSINGDWGKVADPKAANGIKIKNANKNEPKITQASAQPKDFIEAKFNAKANTLYHIWLRMEAQNNYYGNDSVHVQFTDSLNDRGEPAYRIGTTGSLEIVLEEGQNAGISGWGWNDNHYGLLGSNFMFANDGEQTIRIQQREDGVSIDQIVISPSDYLSRRPGLTKNDSTIISKPSPAPTPIPPTPTPTLTPTPNPAPSPTPVSTPIPTQLDIWWPTNGAIVSGTQPFKAMVENLPATEYEMFWQVDGGGLNPMYFSPIDYPHQETMVDLSGWTWKGAGPYSVNFIARKNGQAILEKAINIFIGN